MPATATERSAAPYDAAGRLDVAPIVRAYLAAAGGDAHRALADAIADALLELDACAAALRERDRLVSAGYVRAGRPTQGRP